MQLLLHFPAFKPANRLLLGIRAARQNLISSVTPPFFGCSLKPKTRKSPLCSLAREPVQVLCGVFG